MKKILTFILVSMLLMQTAFAGYFDSSTNWLSSATYGFDGNGIVRKFHYQDEGSQYVFDLGGMDAYIEKHIKPELDENLDYWFDMYEQSGAAYMMIGLAWAYGFSMAPNPVADEILGVPAGYVNPTTDWLEYIFKKAERRGLNIKFGIYATGDYATRTFAGKMGWTGDPDRHAENCARIYEYWAKKYGDKIVMWWMDGCPESVWTEDRTKLLYNAIKKGNGNAAVAISNGQFAVNGYINRGGNVDMTAGFGIYKISDSEIRLSAVKDGEEIYEVEDGKICAKATVSNYSAAPEKYSERRPC